MTEAAGASFAPWGQPLPSPITHNTTGLATINESDDAALGSDMPEDFVDQERLSLAVDSSVKTQLQQPLQQQEQLSSDLLTDSVDTIADVPRHVQQQAALNIFSEAAAAAEQHEQFPVLQPADDVEAAVLVAAATQSAASEGTLTADSGEGLRPISVKVTVFMTAMLVNIPTA